MRARLVTRSSVLATVLAAMLLLQPLSAGATGGHAERAIARQRAELKKTVYSSRPLQTTPLLLGRVFMEKLLTLPATHHLMDAGSGAHSEVIAAHIASRLRAGLKPAKTTALGLEPPDAQMLAVLQQLNPQHQHLAGKFIEAYKRGEIDPVHLMADQYGPFSYTAEPHKIIGVEGALLAPGGHLFTHVTTSAIKSRAMTQIVDRSGRDVTLDWFAAIRGFKLIHHEALKQGDLTIHQVGLERDGKKAIVAPALKVDGFEEGHPPTRKLIWDGHTPSRAN